MPIATTLPPGLGGTLALLLILLLVTEIAMITVMVVATMGEGRGSMESIEGGIWIGGGTGSKRKGGRVRMIDAMRKIMMRMVLLGFARSRAWIDDDTN